MKVKGVLEKKESEIPEANPTKTLILGLIGLILILIPEALNRIIGILVGLALLVVGLIAINKYINKDKNNLNLVTGILYSVLGVIVMVYPHSVIRLVAICLGVYLLISGLIKLKVALALKDINSKWTGTLAVSILIIVMGLLLIFNPFSGIAVTKLAGFYLVAVAVFELIDIYVIQK